MGRSVVACGRRWKWKILTLAAATLYLLFISFKFPTFLLLIDDDHDDSDTGSSISSSSSGSGTFPHIDSSIHFHDQNINNNNTMTMMMMMMMNPYGGRITFTGRGLGDDNQNQNQTELEKMVDEALTLGTAAWDDLNDAHNSLDLGNTTSSSSSCPSSVSMGGTVKKSEEEEEEEILMFLPCGLSVGSAITIVGKPLEAHEEYVPQIPQSGNGNGIVLISQFKVELQGLKAVDGEDPPIIFHFNPRLRGDWSHTPVIEHNTCYRMHWATAMRCTGLQSQHDHDTVDGFNKCEKWLRTDTEDSKESKSTSWLQRFIGRAKKPLMTWPFPFAEGRLFILTVRAGVEGYHINLGGRHITSFPYRPGFTLEDATGLAIKGDVEIHSVYATSLPQSHPSFSLQRVLEMSDKWKAPPLLGKPIQLFIGILSATNHFAERMAVRKTWMQYSEVKSSNVVARFFVALNPRKEVNAVLKKEAKFFGDIVILPFMDRYELVVLKTIAICEYGVQNLTAAYIMKCDDDTFIRVDVVLNEIRGIRHKRSLYMGNLNLLHQPLRSGKWAVTYEEWPEERYPPYANGPGYIISSDIAEFIVSQHANQSLRLFKMEDVSMGMWVEEFNATMNMVEYSHNWKFCQYGCMENYYTAHYQCPRQMVCLWDKLARGRAHCCNFR